MENKIKYKDLSGWLKLSVVSSFVFGGYLVLVFLIGVIIGVIEVLQ